MTGQRLRQEAAARFGEKALREKYQAIRQRSVQLAADLSPEDQMVQSMPDASPTKWHLAHTTWFFERFVLSEQDRAYQPYCAAYDYLFNSYYNSVGEQYPRSRRGLISRPGVAEVGAYRNSVDEALLSLIESRLTEQMAEVVILGLHHEQQHQELLLTDIKHALFQNPILPAYRSMSGPASGPGDRTTGVDGAGPSRTSFVKYPGGIYQVGHPNDGRFHYDNEGPRHRVLLGDFELAKHPVTNAEVIEFIEAGGYQDPLLWLSEAWSWIEENAISHPLYYRKTSEGQWVEFTLHGEKPVMPAAPAVHLSYFEADAIARFQGRRLPTEAEWEVAAETAEAAGQVCAEVGPDEKWLHPKPRPRGCGESAMTDPEVVQLSSLFGQIWQWTQSPYTPYPGYEPAAGALGEYNGKFMYNQMVLRGGSCVTPPGHLRRTYRNFFPGTARWQFSGVRLARGGRP